MLTRLQVSGFRNLVDADVRFGPFTCVAGPNGAGKSNLFDAIRFLSALADGTLGEAAAAVCRGQGGAEEVHGLFHRSGDRVAARMTFVADMVVPWRAVDDLGQETRASSTLLRYSLELGRRELPDALTRGPLVLVREELIHLRQRDAPHHLRFPHSVSDWRRAVVGGRRPAPSFISTEGVGEHRVVVRHADRGGGVSPVRRAAVGLPRTMLSTASGAYSPTALAARREMQSWQLVQPDPASLRRPDRFGSPSRMAGDGSHLAAALHHLAASQAGAEPRSGPAPLDAISARLGELIGGAHSLQIEVDPERDRLELALLDSGGTIHPAATLADGVLRLLTFLVLAHGPHTRGVLCVEDPDHGIHPAQIPAVLNLLTGMGVDPHQTVSQHNPLRQVIVSTHAPAVLQQVPDDSVVFVRSRAGQAQFLCLPGTWRAADGRHASRDDIEAYLNPVPSRQAGAGGASYRRVADREDLGQLPLFPD
ncbi:MAG: AAA family ATPase [Spirochaetaceae bacterium]|nr:AAA family ATPase [Spirochaetaceae bacterium]